MEKKKCKSLPNKLGNDDLHYGSFFLNDIYRAFRKKTNSTARTIDKKLLKQIVVSMFNEMAEYILSGKPVALPLNCGVLVVDKRKSIKRKIVDFGETIKSDNIVYVDNRHSDGFIFKTVWIKDRPVYGSTIGYKFKLCRVYSRKLAKNIKDGYGYRYQSFNYKKTRKYEI